MVSEQGRLIFEFGMEDYEWWDQEASERGQSPPVYERKGVSADNPDSGGAAYLLFGLCTGTEDGCLVTAVVEETERQEGGRGTFFFPAGHDFPQTRKEGNDFLTGPLADWENGWPGATEKCAGKVIGG